MASIGLLEIFLALIVICFIILGNNNNGIPANWPVVGMLPELLLHLHLGHLHEWITKVLLKSKCNFLLKGPNMKLLFMADPANINYILTSNFTNFHKGHKFKQIFDGLGDGIFNSDSDTWRDQRRLAMGLINHQSFHNLLIRTTTDKVRTGLVSVLNDASGKAVDLQDVFQRLTFDTTCKLVTGFDPGCLSTEFPEIPFTVALDEAEQAVVYRYMLPECVWKLQRWLGVGQEKILSMAYSKTIELVLANYIEEKKEMIRKSGGHQKLNHDHIDDDDGDEQGTDLLTSYLHLGFDDNRFLRDTILNFLFAGRDTVSSALTWFFWNLSQHPSVLTKIRQEITSVAADQTQQEELEIDSNNNFINKLIYLHAAICESLRLYPPVPWNNKHAIKPDTLPSGHRVDPSILIIFSIYAMGRMPSIWGEDCLEFRPERWITDKGGIKHEPSNKFPAFNAGPRSCIGKNMSFIQIKIVVVNIVQKFDVEVVEGQDVKPTPSVVLHVKGGLKVRVSKRS